MVDPHWSKMTALDWTLARIGLFGVFARQARALPRRSLVRFIPLFDHAFIAVTCRLETLTENALANAVSIERRYFSATGRRLPQAPNALEADTITAFPRGKGLHRLWLCPPKGARFAFIDVTRQFGSHEIGFQWDGGVLRARAPGLDSLCDDRDRADLLLHWAQLAKALSSRQGHAGLRHIEEIRVLKDSDAARDIQRHLWALDIDSASARLKELGPLFRFMHGPQ